MGRPIFSPGKEWAGPFFPRGKTDWGEIPACYSGMPFKMHKIIFFPEKKYVGRLPYLKFSDLLSEIHLFFLFGLIYENSLNSYQASTKHQARFGSKLFDTLVVFVKVLILRKKKSEDNKLGMQSYPACICQNIV